MTCKSRIARVRSQQRMVLRHFLFLLLFSVSTAFGEDPAAAKKPDTPDKAGFFDASNLQKPTDLAAIWLIQAGDNPAYSRTDFDDSQWTPFDSNSNIRFSFPNSQPEIVWYRLHVKVNPNQSDLALKTFLLSSAFEIYENGNLLVRSGKIKPFVQYSDSASLLASIPESDRKTGNLVIALRVHNSRQEWRENDAGLNTINVTLGPQQVMQDRIWASLLSTSTLWIELLLNLAVGLVALAVYFLQRRQLEFLWLSLFNLSQFAMWLWLAARSIRNVPQILFELNRLFLVASTIFLVLTYMACMRQRLSAWLWASLVSLTMIGAAIDVSSDFGIAPRWLDDLSSLICWLAVEIPINWVLFLNLRRGNREAKILILPAFLEGCFFTFVQSVVLASQIPSLKVGATRILQVMFGRTWGPFSLNPQVLVGILFVSSWAVILIFRSTQNSRRQALIDGEIAAAREVQQVILPEQIEAIPGFTIESVYAPAQQVGGDFFQILPTPDGGLLLVIGDVAGKGLPAAMLVSVLVGAIRSIADFTVAPGEMMARLNERLIGRANGGFSTALAAHVAADGEVILANAGHLSPYLDGREIELPGALPLGIVSGLRYDTIQFQLAPGSRLTFYSDGVIEAQNSKGELLGFERAQELSTQPAAEIAQAAKLFGQSDDITVVAITRVATVAQAA